jgi:hypothetical protein
MWHYFINGESNGMLIAHYANENWKTVEELSVQLVSEVD